MDRSVGQDRGGSPDPSGNDTSAGAVAESLDWVATIMEVKNFCAGGEIGLGFVGGALLA